MKKSLFITLSLFVIIFCTPNYSFAISHYFTVINRGDGKSTTQIATVIGPFNRLAACKVVADWFIKKGFEVSEIWEANY